MPVRSRIVYSGPVKPQKKISRFWMYAFLFILLAGLAGYGLWYAMNQPFFRIQNIEISGTSRIAVQDIQAAVRAYMSIKRFRIFPGDSIIFLSSQNIGAALEESFPAAENINTTKKLPHTLAVQVKERSLWGLYCPSGAEAANCFFIDANGVAFDRLQTFQGSLFPTIYGQSEPPLGAAAVSQNIIQYYVKSREVLGPLSLHLVSFTLSTSTPKDVELGLEEGFRLIVSLNSDPNDWAGVLKTVLEKEIGDQRPRLEYIDLRFGRKVFYKLR